MTIKFIEIRDRATFIPAVAYRVDGGDHYLARRAGFGVGTSYIFITRLTDNECHWNPNEWQNRRMTRLHSWFYEDGNWDKIASGDVVDAEFILGERALPKVSEGATCQEVVMVVGDRSFQCGDRAIVQVQHRGRAEGPYFMCLKCGAHNIRNRDAELIAGDLED